MSANSKQKSSNDLAIHSMSLDTFSQLYFSFFSFITESMAEYQKLQKMSIMGSIIYSCNQFGALTLVQLRAVSL